MHKLITNSASVDDFYSYVPPWVNTKAYRESFSSLFGVFVKKPDEGPDVYLKLAASLEVFKSRDRPIEFTSMQSLNPSDGVLKLFSTEKELAKATRIHPLLSLLPDQEKL